MDFVLIGLPAVIFLVGFVVVFSTPVWLAARLTGAKHPTLLRAVTKPIESDSIGRAWTHSK